MTSKPNPPHEGIERLLAIMAALRTPETGCPWDLAQDFATIAPYTIEEAYEVADAIDRADWADLRDELGDLLFQAVYHAQMAQEAGHFAFPDVIAAICDKMIRRHPHVFGDADMRDAAEQTRAWEEMKAAERAKKEDHKSVLDGVPANLPALMRAEKLQRRAGRIGFDWPDLGGVRAKLAEEHEELTVEIDAPAPNPAAIEEEYGDFLFAAVNLARHLKIDPEHALRQANLKFERRFKQMEDTLTDTDHGNLAAMEEKWLAAKALEKSKS